MFIVSLMSACRKQADSLSAIIDPNQVRFLSGDQNNLYMYTYLMYYIRINVYAYIYISSYERYRCIYLLCNFLFVCFIYLSHCVCLSVCLYLSLSFFMCVVLSLSSPSSLCLCLSVCLSLVLS